MRGHELPECTAVSGQNRFSVGCGTVGRARPGFGRLPCQSFSSLLRVNTYTHAPLPNSREVAFSHSIFTVLVMTYRKWYFLFIFLN